MSPTNWKHGRLVTQLARFAEEKKSGRVLTGEVGLYTRRNPDTVRGADVLFVSTERLAQVTSDSFLDVAPELVVEVISPGNTWQEMRDKIKERIAHRAAGMRSIPYSLSSSACIANRLNLR